MACLGSTPYQSFLLSFRNSAVDETNASADQTLKITITPDVEVYSIKEESQATQNDVVYFLIVILLSSIFTDAV